MPKVEYWSGRSRNEEKVVQSRIAETPNTAGSGEAFSADKLNHLNLYSEYCP